MSRTLHPFNHLFYFLNEFFNLSNFLNFHSKYPSPGCSQLLSGLLQHSLNWSPFSQPYFLLIYFLCSCHNTNSLFVMRSLNIWSDLSLHYLFFITSPCSPHILSFLLFFQCYSFLMKTLLNSHPYISILLVNATYLSCQLFKCVLYLNILYFKISGWRF